MQNIITPQADNHRPGVKCPECGFFMEFSIVSLLQNTDHVCLGCGLVLSINRSASRESMEALQQLQVAIDNLKSVKETYSDKPR